MKLANISQKLRYIGRGQLLNRTSNETFYSNQTSRISPSFASSSLLLKWQQCCEDAEKCCAYFTNQNLIKSTKRDDNECPGTWDGWTCWKNAVPKSATVEQICPDHIYWHQVIPSCRGYVTKTCSKQAEWFKIRGKEWKELTSVENDNLYFQQENKNEKN
ncbi:Calcitonin receptor-like protein [Dinothrombium tinctorium]|uniref:Calcitonin receptor-like protein n=1 Tax=Dinothrombium tinctorium TaxID=1965070 RepID=A0A3S3P7G1_9ACAR|nr:Calcitonin receptor-like protein [Dinothrombium tinctorium]